MPLRYTPSSSISRPECRGHLRQPPASWKGKVLILIIYFSIRTLPLQEEVVEDALDNVGLDGMYLSGMRRTVDVQDGADVAELPLLKVNARL